MQADNKWNELIAAASSPAAVGANVASGQMHLASKSALLHPAAQYPEQSDEKPVLSGLLLHRAAMAVKMAPKTLNPENLLALALRGAWPMGDSAPFMHEPPKSGKAAGRFSSCMPMVHAVARSAMNQDRFLEQHSSSSSDGRQVSLTAPITPEFLGDKWCHMDQPRAKRGKKVATVAESQQHMTYFNGVFSANSDGTGGLVVQVLEHIGNDSEICIRTNPICIEAGQYLLAASLHDALQRILICRADCRRVNFAVVPGEMQILPGVWMTSGPNEGLFLAALQYEPEDTPRARAGLDLPKRLFGRTTTDGDVVVAWKNGKCPTRAMDRYTSTSEGFEMGFFDDEELVVVLWRENRRVRSAVKPPQAAFPTAPPHSPSTYSALSSTMASTALASMRQGGFKPLDGAAGYGSAAVSSRNLHDSQPTGRGRKRGRPRLNRRTDDNDAAQPSSKQAAWANARTPHAFGSGRYASNMGSRGEQRSQSSMTGAAETVRATAARILASMAGAAQA